MQRAWIWSLVKLRFLVGELRYITCYSWGKKGELKKKQPELNKAKCKDLINLGVSKWVLVVLFAYIFRKIKILKSLKSIIKGNNQHNIFGKIVPWRINHEYGLEMWYVIHCVFSCTLICHWWFLYPFSCYTNHKFQNSFKALQENSNNW